MVALGTRFSKSAVEMFKPSCLATRYCDLPPRWFSCRCMLCKYCGQYCLLTHKKNKKIKNYLCTCMFISFIRYTHTHTPTCKCLHDLSECLCLLNVDTLALNNNFKLHLLATY